MAQPTPPDSTVTGGATSARFVAIRLALLQRFLRPPQRPFNHRAVKFLKRSIRPDTRILEVGAGWWIGALVRERCGHIDAIEGQRDWYKGKRANRRSAGSQ